MLKNTGIILIIIVSFFLGKYTEKNMNAILHENDYTEAERAGTGYLINPLLDCELQTYKSNQKYIPFEDEVTKQISQGVIEKNRDIHVSLYFRNLRNGPWFGIEESSEFAPASLMKLPVTMAYAKWSESSAAVWGLSLTGVSANNDIQNIIPDKSVKPGKTYSVDELIRYSLILSEDNANQTLLKYIPKNNIYKVFQDLGIPILEKLEKGQSEYMSVKEYASFFRILYNASYLSHDMSSYLLDIMTQSVMTGGIRASIPTDIVVAHKFGERRLILEGEKQYISQFHDCGIIYYKNYPYILCIMTKGGDDMLRLEKIVENISSIIFQEIRKKYP